MAMLLLSVVVLCGTAMEMTLRHMSTHMDTEAQLEAEAGSILALVTKKMESAVGDAWNNPLNITVTGSQRRLYRVRQDTNANGQWDATDGTEDFDFVINQNGVRNTLWYGRNGIRLVILSTRVVNFAIGNMAFAGTNGDSIINITVRADPLTAVGPNNPEVLLNSSVHCRSMSLG